MLIPSIFVVALAAIAQTVPTPSGIGERLFHDTALSSTRSIQSIACATCHRESDAEGYRAFTEQRPWSWKPWRYEDPLLETLRNAPALLDLDDHALIHADGEFLSLEDQTAQTLVGRNFGWLPDEEDVAVTWIAERLRTPDDRGGYADSLVRLHVIDPALASDDQLVTIASREIANFVRGLHSARTSPYDAFLVHNGIDAAPQTGETPRQYGERILRRLDGLETTNALRLGEDFPKTALDGYRIFLRTRGDDRVGNCVACHIPPAFTDRSFHNVGVSQAEYDVVHGTGRFSQLDIPAYGKRPRPGYQRRAFAHRPGETDLGYWNFARFENSPLYLPQESEAEFVQRTIAAFKTPGLRNLAATAPYMHNGIYPTLEAVLDQKIQSGFMARQNSLRNPDAELPYIRFIIDDVEALFAFLNTLNDADTRTAVYQGVPVGDGTVAPSSAYTFSQTSD